MTELNTVIAKLQKMDENQRTNYVKENPELARTHMDELIEGYEEMQKWIKNQSFIVQSLTSENESLKKRVAELEEQNKKMRSCVEYYRDADGFDHGYNADKCLQKLDSEWCDK